MNNREQLQTLIRRGRQQLLDEEVIGSEGVWNQEQFRDAQESFLAATGELHQLQGELWTLFEISFGCDPAAGSRENWDRSGRGLLLQGSARSCHFHGVECDFTNRIDGRCLRIDLLPVGILGITSWVGMRLFLRTGRPPGREFPMLRDLLCSGNEAEDFRRFFSLARELVLRGEIVWLGGTRFALPQREISDALS